jgi:diacylglycerol kinase family enzyme
LVIINPASGGTTPVLRQLNSHFQQHDLSWRGIITQPDISLEAQLKPFFTDPTTPPPERVYVYGGDGTIVEAADLLIGSQVPLVPLPGGTYNAFCNDLGIPAQLPQALEMLSSSEQVLPVHTGVANDKPFFISCLLGPISKVNYETTRQSKERLGVLAYIQNFFNQLPQLTTDEFQIEIDGQTHARTGVGVIVLNTAISGMANLSLHKRASLLEPSLEVLVITELHLAQITRALSSLINTGSVESVFESWSGERIRVQSEHEHSLMIDETRLTQRSLDVGMSEEQLRVVVPAQAQTQAQAEQSQKGTADI